MNDCIFCRIVRGEAPARIAYQDDAVTAFHDTRPQAPLHILIVPNRHIPRAADVQPDDESMLGRLFLVAKQVAEQEGVSDGFRLVVNSGQPAGQTVFHLHLHLMAGRRFRWPPG